MEGNVQLIRFWINNNLLKSGVKNGSYFLRRGILQDNVDAVEEICDTTGILCLNLL